MQKSAIICTYYWSLYAGRQWWTFSCILKSPPVLISKWLKIGEQTTIIAFDHHFSANIVKKWVLKFENERNTTIHLPQIALLQFTLYQNNCPLSLLSVTQQCFFKSFIGNRTPFPAFRPISFDHSRRGCFGHRKVCDQTQNRYLVKGRRQKTTRPRRIGPAGPG